MYKQQVARAFVVVEETQIYELQYNLVTETKNNRPYGVEIEMRKDDVTDSEACHELSQNFHEMLNFIDILARHYVMPITLPYIVEDFAPFN